MKNLSISERGRKKTKKQQQKNTNIISLLILYSRNDLISYEIIKKKCQTLDLINAGWTRTWNLGSRSLCQKDGYLEDLCFLLVDGGVVLVELDHVSEQRVQVSV